MWPLILSSIAALAIIGERLWTLQKKTVIPPALLAQVQQWLERKEVDESRLALLRDSSPLGKVLAAGSIGDALAAGEDKGKAYRAAGQLLEAVLGGSAAGYERALKQTPFSARGEFTAMLDALADTLGEAARGALGQPTRRSVPPALLRRGDPAPLLRAMERVAAARDAAYGNVNPQILLAVLGEELAEVL